MESPAFYSSPERARDLAGSAIVVAGIAAYANSFGGQFIFDDLTGIAQNPALHHLWPIWNPYSPEHGGLTVGGRPVVNFTFALNYAVSGTRVWSYHALNLAIHIMAGLTLFGICRRTTERFLPSPGSNLFGFVVALIWTVHPIQTEAVSYVIQRTESLMGLFYLLTLYSFIRYVGWVEGSTAPAPPGPAGQTVQSADQSAEALAKVEATAKVEPMPKVEVSAKADGLTPARRRLWAGLSVVFCLLGMATKEVMVTAPVIVFLYDRTFGAGTFAEAWRRRHRYYLALAATWIVLAALIASTGWNRGGTVGFGTGAAPWSYELTQIKAVAHYLRLCLWPCPLVFDYGTGVVGGLRAVLLPGLVLIILLAGTVFALVRRPALGFLGAWIFLTLAPSSSLIPIVTQTMAEHRIYLALAAVATLIVAGLRIGLGRRGLWVGLALALVLAVLTARRNRIYRTAESLWADTAAHCPGNPRAHNNLGNVLLHQGRVALGIEEFNTALRLNPDYADARNNLGDALYRMGRTDEAVDQLNQALRLNPMAADANNDLGNIFYRRGLTAEAITRYQAALRIEPNHAEAHYNLGNALAAEGRPAEAVEEFEAALRINPEYGEAHDNLGNALLRLDRVPEAMRQFETALQIDPGSARAHNNLGNALLRSGRLQEAGAEFEAALRLDPKSAEAHNNLGKLLHQVGHLAEAIDQFSEALRIDRGSAEARYNLGNTLLDAGRIPEAIRQFRAALDLKPDSAELHNNLGAALCQAGLLGAAIGEFETALRLRPEYPDARENLERARSLAAAHVDRSGSGAGPGN